MKSFLWLIVLSFVTLHGQTAQRAGRLAVGRNGMVVSASEEASRVGRDILRRGGNAVDAAVAVGFALAVTYPSAGNLGGGTFLVIRMADGREAAVDARETAPGAATATMYLDDAGRVIKDLSLKGPVAAGVPGTVDGLLTALQRFGTMDRREVMKDAIRLADQGFPLKPHLAGFLKNMRHAFRDYPSSMKVYYKSDGSPYRAGERWRQPDLAETLEKIARDGRDGFYAGPTAEMIVRQMRNGNGLVSARDLREYACVVRKPVTGSYRGHRIISMPPVSAGGIALLQILNILEGYPLDVSGHGTAVTMHRMIEAERRAYADRSEHVGDPDFVRVPTDDLVSKSYADALRRTITPGSATPSSSVRSGAVPFREGGQTTHYSVMDRWGNAVAVTTTLNSICGGKCVVDGAGFLLNNEMDDFSLKPGTPNQFGLTGGAANGIAPRKRMVSSMTPTIVLKDGDPLLVLGSPGGSTIITTVAQVIINVIDHRMGLPEAVRAPRFHHQWKPDSVLCEPGACPPRRRAELGQMGYSIGDVPALGRVDAIQYDRNSKRLHGYSDPRGHGAAYGY